VPTGIDVAGLAAITPIDPRAAAGWPAQSIVAVSLGRLAPEKNVMTVLEAVSAATSDVPGLRLLVIGGGPSADELRRRAERPDLDGRVRFTGALARPDALRAAAGGDLFVFASRTETQGLVLAEAMGLGLPCVALDGPGVRDSVRDGIDGVVVEAEGVASRADRLGAALGSLASDRARLAALAARASEGADRFSLDRRAVEIEGLYRSLVTAG
jgi:glycosyltransferase involved in cell wall biosynthesis